MYKATQGARARWSSVATAMFACSLLMVGPALGAQRSVDLLIRGGNVVDGSGAPSRIADVAVHAGDIVAVGSDLRFAAGQVLDASGLTVAPGFIDVHNHSEPALTSEAGYLNELFLRQGVTTVVLGPDGELAPSAIEALLNKLGARGAGTNVAVYVGHNGVRTEVLGKEQNRAPSAAELSRMEALVRQGMQLGAVGLSSGLMYSPGLFSETDEVVALAKQVAPFGGVYETHVRDPHAGLLQSDWEAIQIGRQAGVAVNLTHLTTPGKHNRGLMKAVIELIESARREGIEVVADQYPYAAVATVQLWAVLKYPTDLALDTRDQIRAALRDPARRARIRAETLSGGASGYSQYKASGPSSILVLSAPDLAEYEGRFISEIAAQRGIDGFEAIAFLLEHARTDIVVSLGGFYEEDMRLLMRQPWVMIASDGFVGAPEGPARGRFFSGHPRTAGAFARVLGKYVREEKVLTLEEAVRRASSAPAEFLELPRRGRILPGYSADLVVFDADRIADRSTWIDPHAQAVGVVAVLVNGQFAIRDGEMTGTAAGRFVPRALPSQPLRGIKRGARIERSALQGTLVRPTPSFLSRRPT